MKITVEIELDGVLTAKRCPKFTTDAGFVDYAEIRNYFAVLGYRVGPNVRVC